MSMLSSVPIAPGTLRMFLRAQPAYVDNRERAAVVLDQGFKAYDTYVAYKTPIFVASLLNAALSMWMLKQRRKRGPEAVALWSANLVASLGVAYVTRPGTTAPPPAGMSKEDAREFGVVSVIDARRAALKKTNPAFADRVFERMTSLPGIKEPLDANPLVKAAIV